MTLQIAPFLQAVVVNKGSDLHIKAGSAPKVRISGSLVPLQVDPLTADGAWQLIRETMPADVEQHFLDTNEADYALSAPGIGRFRVNAFRARGSAGCVMRLDNVFAASLDGLMGFRRFHLKAPMTLVNAMPVHTSGSGSDGVTVSPSPAIGCNWRGGTSFSYWPLLFRPPSPTARPLCGSRPACSQHKPSRPKGCLSTFSWRIWSGRCRCASGRS